MGRENPNQTVVLTKPAKVARSAMICVASRGQLNGRAEIREWLAYSLEIALKLELR